MIPTLYAFAGKPVTLEGYAQDFGSGVAGVQFSCDEGETWTAYPIEGADGDANVNWRFTFVPPRAGIFELLVRAVRADGTHTPESAHVHIVAQDAQDDSPV